MTTPERNAQRVAIYQFKRELRELLIKHKMDDVTGIPGHILTDFLVAQTMAIGKVQDTIELWRSLRR